MTFTANAGLVMEDVFVPSRFRFPQRQPEARHFTKWFADRDYRIIDLPGEGTFEGEGDALFQPGRRLIWGGYGVRTALQVYPHLARMLDVEVVPLRLVDERFYHLDTCFCPLSGDRVFYYPDAFDRESVEAIRARVPETHRHEIEAEDALQFACNAVEVGGRVIANHVGPALRERLEDWGFEVRTTPLTEFMLAGGAAKCLSLLLTHPPFAESAPKEESAGGLEIVERVVHAEGHLLDTGAMGRMLECITSGGCSFQFEQFQVGLRADQVSHAALRVIAPSPARMEVVLSRLLQMGARVPDDETGARLVEVARDGVAPPDFYSTTIFPTDLMIDGKWVRAEKQRMDAVLVVESGAKRPRVVCKLIRDLKAGDRIACGVEGIRIQPTPAARKGEVFGFMTSGVSSERRVEIAVDEVAWDMRRIRDSGGKIVVVAGPVVIHTGGGPHLASLIRMGYVQALLGGNAIATHDIEQALFGTSLGVDLRRGHSVHGGHRHHLQAINLIRSHGGIDRAVEAGALKSGVMFECIRAGVPFSLAGSIRDDGPLPETRMDLIAAQREYAELIEGAEMILMLSSMLHSIGVGNMTPAGVRLIAVDINHSVMTKLADRGSVESTGIITDVGLFLNLLARRLGMGEKG
jgi:lysine-ketoglutarate reductase/saccharopine dehydrogenase-like protein (TIGR00300 family)